MEIRGEDKIRYERRGEERTCEERRGRKGRVEGESIIKKGRKRKKRGGEENSGE